MTAAFRRPLMILAALFLMSLLPARAAGPQLSSPHTGAAPGPVLARPPGCHLRLVSPSGAWGSGGGGSLRCAGAPDAPCDPAV